MKSIALIPARSGSERVKDKNIYNLNGHPLIAYSIYQALRTKLFDRVVVVTDSSIYAKIAIKYGAEVPKLRPKEISGSSSPDIEWVKWILQYYKKRNVNFKIFSILRPTSPFRKAQSIKKAMKYFIKTKRDSLRAMEITSQHPGKMWRVLNELAYPLLPFDINNTFWHSNQTKILPNIYIQNASLEISYSKFIYENNSITGSTILPYILNGYEGFDINTIEDLDYAEYLISNKKISLDNPIK